MTEYGIDWRHSATHLPLFTVTSHTFPKSFTKQSENTNTNDDDDYEAPKSPGLPFFYNIIIVLSLLILINTRYNTLH